MATSESRNKVLSLYRRIQKLSKSWSGPDEEKKYILKEARTLFHRNKHITDKTKIQAKILEAETRIDLGLHYRNPYPRVYQNYGVYGDDVGKKVIVPAYMVSLFKGDYNIFSCSPKDSYFEEENYKSNAEESPFDSSQTRTEF